MECETLLSFKISVLKDALMQGFNFFRSYYESAQHLSDEDQAHFYKMIMDYMFTGEEPQITGHLMGFWLLVKPNLDISIKRSKAGQNKSKADQKKIKTTSKTEPSPPKEKEKEKERDKDISYGIPTWMDDDAWTSWVMHRKEIRKKLTPTTVSRQISFLTKNQDDHIEIIEQSIQNGWTGLFVLKDKKSAQGSSSAPQEGSLEYRRQQEMKAQEAIDAELV